MAKTIKKAIGATKSDEKIGVDGSAPVPFGFQSAAEPVSEEIPEHAPPPPHIVMVIAQEKNDIALQRIAEDIQSFIDRSSVGKAYNFLFLYDDQESISEMTSSRLYAAASSAFRDRTKPIWLMLHTRGGSPEPAYLISRYLKATEHGFVAVVPRRAKSAGTLIALGAKQIHMGMMSELGPVDPQYSNLPALGLGTALDYIAGVCEKHPDSANMLAKYLENSLSIRHLGLYERVSESATHYAEKLLKRAEFDDARRKEIARHLVYDYKDHSFAIDCDEIKGILGDGIVKVETDEYRLANQIYEYMEQVNMAFHIFHQKYCSFIGLGAEGLRLQDLKQ